MSCLANQPPGTWVIMQRTVTAFRPIMLAATVLGLLLLLLLPWLFRRPVSAPLSQRQVVLRDGLALAGIVATGFTLGPVALIGGLSSVLGMVLVLRRHRDDPYWQRSL